MDSIASLLRSLTRMSGVGVAVFFVLSFGCSQERPGDKPPASTSEVQEVPTEVPDSVPYDTPPQPLKLVKPEYPEAARAAGIKGVVVLQVLVSTDGHVTDVRVLRSLEQSCDSAAVEAARACRFSPALYRRKPVAVWVSYPVQFRLTD